MPHYTDNTQPNLKENSKTLIIQGKVTYLDPKFAPKPPTHQSKAFSPLYITTKSQLEYPKLIKIIENKTNNSLDFSSISMRLSLMKVPHAKVRNNFYSAYIDKPNLADIKETVHRQSSGHWSVIEI